MICPHCGAAVEDGSAFCNKCGSPLGGDDVYGAAPSQGNPAAPSQGNLAQPAGQAYASGLSSEQLAATPFAPAYAQAAQPSPDGASASPFGQPSGQASDHGVSSARAADQGYDTAQPQSVPGPVEQVQKTAIRPESYRDATAKDANGSPGTTSLVMGILSIVLSASALVGLVLGIVALAQGGKVLRANPEDSRAKTGRITGIVGIVLSALAMVAYLVMMVLGLILSSGAAPGTNAAGSPGSAQVQSADGGAASSSGGAASEGAGGTQAQGGSTASPSVSELLDSWAPECFDDNGNPSVYALLELKGFQLETLLQQMGWEWKADAMAWTRSDGSSLAAMDASNNLMDDFAIGDLDKGGSGTAVSYLLVQPGYANVNDALAATKCVNEATFTSDESAGMAVVYGPSMEEHFAVVNVSSEGATWLIFSEEAVKAGMVGSTLGAEGLAATTIPELWKEITGEDIGAQDAAAEGAASEGAASEGAASEGA